MHDNCFERWKIMLINPLIMHIMNETEKTLSQRITAHYGQNVEDSTYKLSGVLTLTLTCRRTQINFTFSLCFFLEVEKSRRSTAKPVRNTIRSSIQTSVCIMVPADRLNFSLFKNSSWSFFDSKQPNEIHSNKVFKFHLVTSTFHRSNVQVP